MERRRVRVVESAAGRYVVELAGWYVVCDDTRRNPAGLPNDAGAEHANVKCLGSGKMEAARDIAIGEELYWCYGEKYWKYWSTRPARNKLTKETAEAGVSLSIPCRAVPWGEDTFVFLGSCSYDGDTFLNTFLSEFFCVPPVYVEGPED